MKISLPFSILSFGFVAALSVVGCDAGSDIKACSADSECSEGQVCTDSQCILASTPLCADDSDCDLANNQTPGAQTACSADDDCNAAGGEVCVEDGVGTTYCVLADSDNVGEGCEERDTNFEAVTIDGKAVCVVDANKSCDEDGQCV